MHNFGFNLVKCNYQHKLSSSLITFFPVLAKLPYLASSWFSEHSVHKSETQALWRDAAIDNVDPVAVERDVRGYLLLAAVDKAGLSGIVLVTLAIDNQVFRLTVAAHCYLSLQKDNS